MHPPNNPVQLSTALANDVWYSSALILHVVKYLDFEFEEKTTYLIFPTMKGSINSGMELLGFGTSKRLRAIGLEH